MSATILETTGKNGAEATRRRIDYLHKSVDDLVPLQKSSSRTCLAKHSGTRQDEICLGTEYLDRFKLE